MNAEDVRLLIENGYRDIVPIDGERYACIYKFAYTHAIIVGHWKYHAGYDNRWCFHDFTKARTALFNWAADDFKGEPQGWHRHPDSGRRRPEGDATQEYVKL